jgi:gag-polyprotein putative aspartyl protease
MDEVQVQLRLENAGDGILAEAGHLDASAVRGASVEALVDTRAVMALLPQDLVERLGLPTNGSIIVTLANEQRVELPRARHLSLAIGDREMDTDCLVGSPQCEPLVGQLVLERRSDRRPAAAHGDTAARIAVLAVPEAQVKRW